MIVFTPSTHRILDYGAQEVVFKLLPNQNCVNRCSSQLVCWTSGKSCLECDPFLFFPLDSPVSPPWRSVPPAAKLTFEPLSSPYCPGSTFALSFGVPLRHPVRSSGVGGWEDMGPTPPTIDGAVSGKGFLLGVLLPAVQKRSKESK